jgi:diguanylate cyclase (GGDEF)-like protein
VVAVLTALLAAGQALPLRSQGAPASVATNGRRLADLKKRIEADNRIHPVASVQAGEEALTLLEGSPDPKLEAWFLLAVVRDHNMLNDPARALVLLERGRALARATGDERSRLLLEVEAASLAAYREKPAEAKLLLDPVIEPLEHLRKHQPHDSELNLALGRGYRIAGSAARDLRRFPEGIAFYQKAQKLYEELNQKRGLAQVLDQMAGLYALLGRLDEAVSTHKQAILMAEANGDHDLLPPFHLGLANDYGSLLAAGPQLNELKIAIALAEKIQDQDTLVISAVNLADAYLHEKDYRATLKAAEAAIKVAGAANQPSSVAVSQINRGIALNRLGNSAEGIRAVQTGLDYFKGTHADTNIVELTGVLSEELAFAGDYHRAYDTSVLFKQLSDKLFQSQDQKHIAEAIASFENDKKQIQIDALQRDKANQARLRILWIASGLLGFATAGVLVVGRKKLQTVNRALADMSLRDPLTSLANRRYLASRITEDLAHIHRLQRLSSNETAKSRIAINIDVLFLMIDIDHFKHVNDQYGHAAGDHVLKQFADVLTRTMRDSDTVVRWGGEEFFVLAKHTSRSEASILAERILSSVANHPFDLGNGQIIHKTCSIGYSSYPFFRRNPAKVPWEKVAEVADQCLYAAKAMGRNTWVGVHEAEDSPEAFQDQMGGYPEVPELVAKGILKMETRNNQPAVWPS